MITVLSLAMRMLLIMRMVLTINRATRFQSLSVVLAVLKLAFFANSLLLLFV